MLPLTPEQLLAEIEDVIRCMPVQNVIHEASSENLDWMGRAAAVMHECDDIRAIMFDTDITNIQRARTNTVASGHKGALTKLHQAAYQLRI